MLLQAQTGSTLHHHDLPIVWESASWRLRLGSDLMLRFRLNHPELDFWVDFSIHERDGRYMATADLAEDSRDVGVGDTPQETVTTR